MVTLKENTEIYANLFFVILYVTNSLTTPAAAAAIRDSYPASMATSWCTHIHSDCHGSQSREHTEQNNANELTEILSILTADNCENIDRQLEPDLWLQLYVSQLSSRLELYGNYANNQ